MKSLLSHSRTFAFIGIGVLVAFAGWWILTPDEAPESLLTTESVGGSEGVDRSLVDTLLTLRAVSLSGTIFVEPAFMALQDFGIQIVAEPVGRPNPFAPIILRPTTTSQSSLFAPSRR